MICDLPRWRHCVTSRRYCHATVMLLSCYCHATVMLLSCYCHATVMLLSALSPGLLDIFVQRRVTGKTGEVIHLQRLGPRGISDLSRTIIYIYIYIYIYNYPRFCIFDFWVGFTAASRPQSNMASSLRQA